MDKPLVTIGVCSKTRVPKETLQSIFNQTYRPFEVIVVLHGEEQRDKYVPGCRTFFEKRGLGMARQIVVENAYGKYIAWVDDDHVLPADYLACQVEFMEKHPDTAAGQSYVAAHPQAKIFGKIEAAVWRVYTRRISSTTDVPVGSAGVIYRTDALREVGGYDVDCKGACEDGDVCLRLLKAGWKLRVNPNCFYYAFKDESLHRLWYRSTWYGRGARWLNKKYSRQIVNVFRHVPPIAFVAALRHLVPLSKEIPLHLCLLHPFLYSLKGAAWIWGYYFQK
ncbi:MAG: glycosyltransferase family A protein [Candidatus Caldarchaeum sp.]